mgnify:CR=1 FL=1
MERGRGQDQGVGGAVSAPSRFPAAHCVLTRTPTSIRPLLLLLVVMMMIVTIVIVVGGAVTSAAYAIVTCNPAPIALLLLEVMIGSKLGTIIAIASHHQLPPSGIGHSASGGGGGDAADTGIAPHRLLTLVGISGVGTTTIAPQCALQAGLFGPALGGYTHAD